MRNASPPSLISREEGGELARLRAARVLHALFVRRELDRQQVHVVGVSVTSEHCAMRNAMAFGLGHPRVEVGVELVDPASSLNSMICVNFIDALDLGFEHDVERRFRDPAQGRESGAR